MPLVKEVCGFRGEEAPLAQADRSKTEAATTMKTSQWQGAQQAHLQALVAPMGYKVGFSVDDRSGRVVCQLRDQKTDEVVRQIPPEEVLDLAAKMDKMTGLILDRVL
ncbi:MAG: flagellar protein FlaG [Pseudomonadota bacterium]